MARKPVLVQIDPELLARLDAYAKTEFAGNRSRAIGEAVQLLLAQHAAHAAALRRREPANGGWLIPQTADLVADTVDRPLTADLVDR
jgi:hypothetical protein